MERRTWKVMNAKSSCLVGTINRSNFEFVCPEENVDVTQLGNPTNGTLAPASNGNVSSEAEANVGMIENDLPTSWVVLSRSCRIADGSPHTPQEGGRPDHQEDEKGESAQQEMEQHAEIQECSMRSSLEHRTTTLTSSWFGTCNSSLHADIERSEVGPTTPFNPSWHSACTENNTVEASDNSQPADATLSSIEDLRRSNDILRALLAQSDKVVAQSLLGKEAAARELGDMRSTLSALLANTESRSNVFRGPRSHRLHQPAVPEQSEPPNENQPFHLFGWLQQFLFGDSERESQDSGSSQREQEDHTHTDEHFDILDSPLPLRGGLSWRSHFDTARRCAQRGKNQEAFASLLLGITSEDFCEWNLLLEENEKCNFLSGPHRLRWDCIIADKLCEFLWSDKVVEVNGTLPHEEPVTPNPERPNPVAIADFVLGTIARHFGNGRTDGQMSQEMPSAGADGGSDSEDRTRNSLGTQQPAPPSPGPPFRTLENILSIATSIFPSDVSLLYAQASLCAVLGRQEDSIRLLNEVIVREPGCLLRYGGCGVKQ